MIAWFIKPLIIDLYKTCNTNLVEEEAACRTTVPWNDNRKSISSKDLNKLIGNEKSIEPEVVKTMIDKNVEEKFEKAVSKKTNQLKEIIHEIKQKQKEFKKK